MFTASNLVGDDFCWIDRGRLFPLDPIEARDNANHPFHPHALTFTYRDMRLVRVETRPGNLTLRWSVDYADPSSLASALDIVARHPVTVHLHYEKDAWAKETICTGRAAADRVCQIQTFRGQPGPPGMSMTRLDSGAATNCGLLIQMALSATRPRWDLSDLANNQALARRGLVFRGDREALYFQSVGPASALAGLVGDKAALDLVGNPCDLAFSDQSFDTAVTRSYYETMEEGVPRLEHAIGYVDTGPYAIWLPFQRYLMPLPTGLASFVEITRAVTVDFLGQPLCASR